MEYTIEQRKSLAACYTALLEYHRQKKLRLAEAAEKEAQDRMEEQESEAKNDPAPPKTNDNPL